MKRLLIIFLILFSLTGINLFQIESVIITPFHIFSVVFVFVTLLYQKQRLPTNMKYVFFILLSIIFSILINATTFIGFNTFIHSMFYMLIYCIVLLNLKKITLEMFIASLKIIIIIYFICVLFALITVSLHLNNNFINQFFGAIYDTKQMEYRYYGFSSEPSYMAIIVSFAMFALFIINKAKKIDGIFLFFIMYGIIIFLSKSGYGYIFLLVISIFEYSKYLKGKRAIILASIVALSVFIFFNYKSEGRFAKILVTIFSNTSFTNKIEAWKFVDSSSYFRIGPTLWLMDNIDLFSLRTLFGHGMGADREFFYKFSPGYNFGYLNLGFIPSFIYTNGLLLFSFMLYFFYQIQKEVRSFLLFFAFSIILFNCGFATQIFWFIISLLTILSNLCEKLKHDNT